MLWIRITWNTIYCTVDKFISIHILWFHLETKKVDNSKIIKISIYPGFVYITWCHSIRRITSTLSWRRNQINNISIKQNLYFHSVYCQHPLCYIWQKINIIKHASKYLSLLQSDLPFDTNHLNHSMYMVYNTYSKKSIIKWTIIINQFCIKKSLFFMVDINGFYVLGQLLKSIDVNRCHSKYN